MIQRQTYKNIKEWIIVEGSQLKTDADKNKDNIKQFIAEIKTQVNFTIKYIEYTGKKLGGLRNVGNKSCSGDIMVCMDDDNHSTNNCMAYKKKYLLDHTYDPDKEFAEEGHFTFNFTSPLVKLDPRKTVICISHDINTVSKTYFCLGSIDGSLNILDEIKEPITNYIEEDIYKQMKALYIK